jgi:alginate O-acetyltransferase complex protein AlgI
MVFSSFIFLLLFLPFTILVNFLLPKKLSNAFLLVVSLIFYYYGEEKLTYILICSILWNYVFGLLIGVSQKNGSNTKLTHLYLFSAVTGNLLLLGYYKYFVFLIQSIGLTSYFSETTLSSIIMPIGISFFTFHGISYLVDIYRNEAKPVKNIIDMGLYISFFPQLIAGPIIKYHDIADQLKARKIIADDVRIGINRFIGGLAKKILLANNFAFVADAVFDSEINDLSTPTAWLGICCYTLQIYYDFSGYSDMAIGLGKMMGFHFKENFDYPYISKSIQEFWRRWHISLSTWFKEYVYIPLGGNRKGKNRMLLNLLIVFVLTGFWHGASYNFLIWGLIHGLFIVLEKIPFPKIPKRLIGIKHLYVLGVVMIAWVFFRVETLENSVLFLKKMFAFDTEGSYYAFIFLSPYLLFILFIGLLFATPFRKLLALKLEHLSVKNELLHFSVKHGFYLLLFLFTLLELSSLSYNPFIYYRF